MINWLKTLMARAEHPRGGDAEAASDFFDPGPCLDFEPVPEDLAPLVARVAHATRGLVTVDAIDLELIIHEALWQIAHQVRLGETVRVPELGELRREGSQVHFSPDFGLLEDAHG